ncbi:DUF3231 family protein [Mangrovibacillus cuniculi]|uniref:DUF3231 family protein n=1 Tax=Mangrovibacillus cuniculi TaxID=2593652 RepID=A0A7S8CAR5_9BACI|nr:DUF3231 family protein [Mangrovibacillus cuniculi]QPC46530.1 DUF3231 family protein [Mangrovibacillus cuniculi]
MQNPLEAIWSTLKTKFDGEPETDLHVGEVMALWTIYTMMCEAIAFYGVFLNTTTDKDLINAIQSAHIETERGINTLKDFFKREGIPLPPVSQEKPDSESKDVPIGVRFTDEEIANFLSVKTATYISFAGTSLAQCIRMDVGYFFSDLLSNTLTYNIKLKKTLIQKGWLKVPPAWGQKL